ncbi:MAG TPA: amino acid ABC transporter substrate-binding protein [Ktedonobacteraceae bacterium]
MLKWHIERSRGLLSVLACLMVVFAGLSACAQGQSSGNTFANPNPITIGVSLSNSGDFKDDGKAMEQGYQLWADMVNSSGGLLGHQVVLKILHDDSSEKAVANNYQQLISQDKVDLVFGPFSSLLTKQAAPVAQQYHYALIEGAGGAPSVFDKGWSNLFDVSLPVANNLITFAYYILSLPPDQRPKTAAYLSSDDPFTFPQVELARTLLQNAGVKTVYPTGLKVNMPQDDKTLNALPPGYEQFNEGDTKTAAADAKLVAQSGAEIAVLGTLLPDVKAEVQVFKDQKYNPKAVIATAGPDAGQDFINTVGGTHFTEGFFVPNGWYPEATNYQNAEMVQAYLAKYGGTQDQINADVAEAFSVGQVVQQAAEKKNSIDNAVLIKELQSGDIFNTVQGTAQFSSNSQTMGQNLQAIAYLFQWQGGQFIPVYPYSNAKQNPEYPRPANF